MDGSHRALLETLYRAGVDAVAGRSVVRQALERAPPEEPVALLAIGKAADSMTRGALQVLEERLHSGLVITKHGHLSPVCAGHSALRCLEAGHPLPDAGTLEAGRALLEFLDTLPADLPLLVLISGGASSLVEVLPEGFGRSQLVALNAWLLERNLSIDRVNAVRRAVSCIKGGRLAQRLHGRSARALLISDVPDDDPAVIGSGLLFAATEEPPLPDALPADIRAMIVAAPPLPRAGDPDLPDVPAEIVASNRLARETVMRRAEALQLPVRHHRRLLQGDALAAAEEIADQLIHGPPGLQLWGGETTVSLPPDPGRGGRAQALALRAAMAFEGQHGLWLLAAGTDGTDGPGDDAGALVDVDTCFRGRQAGLDPDTCLDAADSGTFLAASGDLIRTGPTGTNVMDLVIGLKE